MTWRVNAWNAGGYASSETEYDEGESPDEGGNPPEIDPFFATFGRD